MIFGSALQLTETVAPSVEPLSLGEAKIHLRIDSNDENTYISALITAARQHVEAITGRALITRTYRLDMPLWDSEVILPRPPLVSVTNIKYYDTANAQQTWAASNYDVIVPAGSIKLSDAGTIPSVFNRPDAWQATYVAGYLSTSSPQDPQAAVPWAIKAAMNLMIADLYENRERGVIGPVFADRKAFEALLGPYRARL